MVRPAHEGFTHCSTQRGKQRISEPHFSVRISNLEADSKLVFPSSKAMSQIEACPHQPGFVELLSKVVDGASGGDLILPDSVDEFHIFNDLSQAAVAW